MLAELRGCLSPVPSGLEEDAVKPYVGGKTLSQKLSIRLALNSDEFGSIGMRARVSSDWR